MAKGIATETSDYRTYEPEIVEDGQGHRIVIRLCEDLDRESGRWEPFYSELPYSAAQAILAAAGYTS
jgi:hypothetical protein